MVSNAIKYTNHGSVTLRLGIQPDGEKLRLTISAYAGHGRT